ncbi:MAG: chlorophyll synthesis pathway protein BchC [Pseudomonadota bacterium]
MLSRAVVLEAPRRLSVADVTLRKPGPGDCVVEVEFSGISTGTEKLLYTGSMPPFPGLGYPLVPGYESAGVVVEAGPESGRRVGERVFVPGSNGFEDVRGLFGGAASRLVAAGDRLASIETSNGPEGALLALAATARHAMAGHALPELIVGHGALGRLLARLAVAAGGAPTVWELNPDRMQGAEGYAVVTPDDDPRRDYGCIYDCSGDVKVLDQLVMRLAKGGEIVLAGFYAEPVAFAFPPAFMKEARFRVAAEWSPDDLSAVSAMLESGALSLGGLVTHTARAQDAAEAYRTAFEDAACLKMILDWRASA